MVRDGLYDKSDTTTTTQNSDGSATQTTSYENPFYNALVTGASMLAGGSLAGAAGQNSMGGLTTAENEALNNALSAKQKQMLAHAFSFEAQPAGSITQSDAANTLAALKLAQNDPSLTSTARGYFTSTTLSYCSQRRLFQWRSAVEALCSYRVARAIATYCRRQVGVEHLSLSAMPQTRLLVHIPSTR